MQRYFPRARLSRTAAAMLLAAALLAAGRSPARAQSPAPVPAAELVVLVHGMGRTPLSMVPLARTLEREGYRVATWGYSSLCCSVGELAGALRTEVEARRDDAARVHFVTHSLGGIVVRRMLADPHPPRGVGRVVMLAPPNQGSRTADRLAGWFGWLLRPLPELRTDSGSTVRALPPSLPVEVGVIAGRYDGKVSPAETHLAGERDHAVVPATHSFLMFRDDVQRMTLAFLRTGSFAATRGRNRN